MGGAADRDDLYGYEWDFLARDHHGFMAVLSSAGYGPIPQAVLDNVTAVESAVETLVGLCVLGESIDLRPPGSTGDHSEWFALSRRGVYTYDWNSTHGSYERVSAPTVALNIMDAEPSIQRAAALLTLPFRFAEVTRIRLDESCP